MSTRTLLLKIVVCGVFFGAAPLFASGIINPVFTPCPSSFVLSSVVIGSGCTLGGEFSVSNFDFTASAGAPLSASQIIVTPTVTITSGVVVFVDLNFSGNFSNPTANPLEYTFDYILDPLPPVINGASITLDPGGILTEQICAGGFFVGINCTPNTAFTSTLVATSLNPSASTAFPNGVSEVDYHLVLDLPPGTSANSFSSGSVTGLGQVGAVPEPSTNLLMAAGLLGLLALPGLRRVVLKFLS